MVTDTRFPQERSRLRFWEYTANDSGLRRHTKDGARPPLETTAHRRDI
jgi:hypothetical protein